MEEPVQPLAVTWYAREHNILFHHAYYDEFGSAEKLVELYNAMKKRALKAEAEVQVLSLALNDSRAECVNLQTRIDHPGYLP